MIKKKSGFLTFLILFILLLPGLLVSAIPNEGEWTGTTSRGHSISFDVGSGSNQWSNFSLETDWSSGDSSGTIEINVEGPEDISGNRFRYYGDGYYFDGEFTSPSTASGTYTFTDYKITISDNPYPQYYYLNQTGEWTATGPFFEIDPPFGFFDTPVHGSTVRSSIAVTGWALDDSGIDSVKIYRTEGNTDVYIGDAILVEGARPDVAALYPQYPGNTRAGWGYMMLTNFLPNSGNGTFIIKAIATDIVGKETTLGTKTIYSDNANAVKPFGAIDTPTQGGTASGSSFVNWGWALTPQPNHIPTDGSTINVFVDSVSIGHPTYNNFRADIATLFPGYANSNGAAGYFSLDTTGYADGVHTIYWTASDSAGNADGIGSRYFTIQNISSDSTNKAKSHAVSHSMHQVMELLIEYSVPVKVRRGFNENVEPRIVHPGEKGISRIKLRELERVEIQLSDEASNIYGYMVAGSQLRPLPIGSTLDARTGTFLWQPGPGFIGEYRLLFILKDNYNSGHMTRKFITLDIFPKFSKQD